MPEQNSDASDLAASGAVGNSWVPQFTPADYGKRASRRCDLCSDLIFSECYRVNGQRICSVCADQVRSGISTASLGSLSGALLIGFTGTVAGMLIYASVTTAMGWTVDYFSLIVGWIVGRAVIAGARGIGSFRIQGLAAFLTYIAVALNPMPAFLYYAYRRGITFDDLRSLLHEIILPGLIAPFTRLNADPVNGGINLFILVLGMGVAWRLTRVQPLNVAGPFLLK
jgi:hypothetical protein